MYLDFFYYVGTSVFNTIKIAIGLTDRVSYLTILIRTETVSKVFSLFYL
jgi:hypothetical protein